MTDKSFPDEPENHRRTGSRSPRTRRAAMAYQEPEQKTPPGQPEVTRFRKASDRRTLIVSLLSLVGHRAGIRWRSFSQRPERGDEKGSDTAPPSSGAVLQERKNLGMDSNPFGLFGPGGRKAQALPVRAPRPLQFCRPGHPP